jgi:hypothetical protein
LGGVLAVDELLPNSAENGNKLGRDSAGRESAGRDSAGRLSAELLAGEAAGALPVFGANAGGELPVFGNGAGTGSGTFSLTAGSAKVGDTTTSAMPTARMALAHKITAWRAAGAIAIRPDLAGRCGAMIPLPPMRSVRTPRYASPVTQSPAETNLAKCALWQIRD